MEPVFRILGPLEVSLDERLVVARRATGAGDAGRPAAQCGEVVSVERLIDGVWGEARPPSAKHMVHEYVSRLRQALGEVAPIETRPPGYLLSRPAGRWMPELFVAAHRGGSRGGRDGDHDEALRSYDQALASGEGMRWPTSQLEGEAQIAVARLDQERRLVGEERIDCALALGRTCS